MVLPRVLFWEESGSWVNLNAIDKERKALIHSSMGQYLVKRLYRNLLGKNLEAITSAMKISIDSGYTDYK